MSDDLADIALSKILGERDDVAGERLVNLFNSVRPQTVATTVTACAQIMGSVLAECPEEVREDFWRAFEKLTFGCMKIKQGLH